MRAKQHNFSGATINHLNIVKLIGQGNWADVYLAEQTQSHKKAAVKVTPLKKLVEIPKLRQLVSAQIAILKQCHNPNVVQLISDFIHADHQFIVLEYCSGFELGDILLRQKNLQEPLAVNYLKQILNGFKGLHEVKAMHRDFKVQNVMLHEGVCKIVDLGFGKQLIGEQVTRTKLGSNLTMAPQVMMGLPYDFKADIWSIGVVFYQMLYGKFPFQARTPMALLDKARKNDYSLEEEDVSDQCKDFIKHCLKFDPLERITWADIYKHPLIADQNNEVNFGPPQSKINVSYNQEFYLSLEKELERQVAVPSAIKHRYSHQQQKYIEPHAKKSIIRPFLHNQEKYKEQHYQPEYPIQQEDFQKQPSQIFLSGIREEARINEINRTQEIRHLQLAKREQELSEEILRNERLKVSNKIKNIKYLYMQKLQDIEFMSRYSLATMRDTADQCEINNIPVICLLLKDAYLRIQKLNDQVNLRVNTFKVDEIEFAYFIDDSEIPQILRNHMQEYKQMFYENRGFLSEEEYRDQRLRKELQSAHSKDNFPDYLLEEYLNKHAKLISNVDLSNNWPVYCKLLKLSFCLVKYSKHKNNNFSRKRILATVNSINYQRQYLNQLNKAQVNNSSHNSSKKNNQPQNVVYTRRKKLIPIFGFFRFIFGR